MFRTFFIFLFFACGVVDAQTVADSARFVHMDITNGFPSNNVYSFLKDRKGYMWFTTDKGVVKYNGYSFVEFNTSTGLPDDDVWQLYCDNRDRIWLYGFGYEFGYIKDNKYRAIPVKSDERIFSSYHLTEKGDVLYFLTGRQMDKLVMVADDLVKEFPTRSGNSSLDENNVILKLGSNMDLLYKDVITNRVYTRSLIAGNGESRLICTMPVSNALLKIKQNFSPINKIYQFKFNGDEIHLLNLDSCSEKVLTLKEMGAAESEKIYVFNPHYMRSNTTKESVLVTERYMYVVDSNLNFIKKIPLTEVIPSKSQLSYRIVDNMGNTWMATNSDGVWAKPAKYSIYTYSEELKGLEDKKYLGHIGSRTYWGDNKARSIYVVERNKVVNRIQLEENIFFKSVCGNDSLLYIASIAGLYVYDNKTKNIEALPEPDRIETGSVYAEDVLFQDVLSHLNKVVLDGNRLYTIAFDYTIAHDIARDSLISHLICYDRFDNVISDTTAGKLVLYNKEKIWIKDIRTGKETTFNKAALINLGIGNIKQIERDTYGNWYVLDDEHITVWNVPLKKMQKLQLNVNLRGAFLRISGDKVVVAGDFGVGYSSIRNVFSFSNFYFVPNYSIGKSNYHQINAFSMTSDSCGLVQTDLGMLSFTLPQLVKDAHLNTAGNDLFRLVLKTPAERRLMLNDTLRVSQNQNTLSFDAINYYGKGELTYEYSIVASGKNVSSASGEIFLELLKPGEYHEVLYRIKDELYQSPVYRLYIYRYPLWWQTKTWQTVFWVCGVILFLLLGLLTILVTRFYVAKKNERKRALTELELQAIHSQINPHFIFNTLSAALFYINKKRFDDAYTHVTKFSQLLRSYLKSSQDRYVILEEEIKMLRNYIELQQIRFEEKFEYKIQIDNKLPLGNIKIPSLLLQPLVENAINHGLFHRQDGGVLLLRFEQGIDNTELVCTIEDNGVGRDAAKKIYESSAKRESYGTKLTHQLLDVFKQYENLNIKLSYIDKEYPETGTVVTLTLKNIKYVA